MGKKSSKDRLRVNVRAQLMHFVPQILFEFESALEILFRISFKTKFFSSLEFSLSIPYAIPSRHPQGKTRVHLIPVQNILVKKYGFSTEAASNVTQNFLKNFRKCPENIEFPLHDWRHMLWKKCLGENHSEVSGEIYCQWLNLRYKYIAPSSEVISLLEVLRKTYSLAMITNGPSNSQWEKIKRLRLNQYFDLILVSGDLKWEKPNKNIFLEACIQLGLSPKECIMVGDKLETDILGGIEAGLGGTVWVPLLGNSVTVHNLNIVPDYVMSDLTELKFLLSFDDFQSSEAFRPLNIKVLDVEDGSSNESDGS